MNETLHQQTKNAVRGRTPLVAALVFGCLFGTVHQAAAQGVTPPPTPAAPTASWTVSPRLYGSHSIHKFLRIALPESYSLKRRR